MDREAIRALIQQAYDKRGAGDIEATLAAFHPEGRLEIAGSKTLSSAVGIAQGQDQLRASLGSLIATFAFSQRDIVSMIIDGDRAAVHSRVTLRFVPKNQTLTTELVDLFRFKDGKIIELVEFIDTAAIGDLMR
jgi:ketosteroid isomerase-like protein